MPTYQGNDYTQVFKREPNSCLEIHNYSDIIHECLKCKKIMPATKCSNCGDSNFEMKCTSNLLIGWECDKCRQGIITWKCNCGCVNNYLGTTFTKKSGCFIATACYGHCEAPEVKVLRQFRDEVLLKNLMGKVFTRFYYAISPPIANFITSREYLKNFIRTTVVAASVKWATSRLKYVSPNRKNRRGQPLIREKD